MTFTPKLYFFVYWFSLAGNLAFEISNEIIATTGASTNSASIDVTAVCRFVLADARTSLRKRHTSTRSRDSLVFSDSASSCPSGISNHACSPWTEGPGVLDAVCVDVWSVSFKYRQVDYTVISTMRTPGVWSLGATSTGGDPEILINID